MPLYIEGLFLSAPSGQKLQDDARIWKVGLQSYGLKLKITRTEHMEVGSRTGDSLSVDESLLKLSSFNIWEAATRVHDAQRGVNE